MTVAQQTRKRRRKMGTQVRARVVAIYCRVSSPKQSAEDKHSLATQRRACLKRAHEMGLVAGEGLVVEEVQSGLELYDREQLAHLRKAVKAGEVTHLMAYATDRLARDPDHLGVVLSECAYHGVEVVLVTEELDDTPMGQAMRTLHGLFARIEAAKIRERTMRGRAERLEGGRLAGNTPAPYGLRYTDETKSAYEPDDTPVGPGLVTGVTTKAGVVAYLWREVAAGTAKAVICRRLDADGVLPPSGGANGWSPQIVRYMLANTAYQGVVRARVWTVVRERAEDGTPLRRRTRRADDDPLVVALPGVEALVTPEMAAAVARAPRPVNARNQEFPDEFLLKDRLRCGCGCDYALAARSKKNDSRAGTYSHQYVTVSKYADAHVGGEWAKVARELDGEVWDFLVRAVTRREIIEGELARRDAAGEDATAVRGYDAQLANLGEQAESYERAVGMAKTPEMMARFVGLAEDCRARAERLTDEREVVARRLADERLAYEQAVALFAWGEGGGPLLMALPMADRRRVLDLLGVTVRMTDPKASGDWWALECSVPEVARLLELPFTGNRTSTVSGKSRGGPVPLAFSRAAYLATS